jgi:hypothetical protein
MNYRWERVKRHGRPTDAGDRNGCHDRDLQSGHLRLQRCERHADDMDGKASDGADPIVYFPITPAAGGSTASYSIPLLEVGAYMLAGTCQFDVDADPSVSEYDPTGNGAGTRRTGAARIPDHEVRGRATRPSPTVARRPRQFALTGARGRSIERADINPLHSRGSS